MNDPKLSPPLNLLIVDDEAPARKRLRELLDDVAESQPINILGEAKNGIEALEQLAKFSVDVMLLDIRMPDMDGLELAQHVQKHPSPPAIIFTTAYDSYACQAFEVSAVDYLLKPMKSERLLAALQKAKVLAPERLEKLQHLRPHRHANLSVYERGKIILVPIEDIVYLRAELKYVTVRTLEREYLVEESLVKLEEDFSDFFVRVYRNCLVARKFIIGFERAEDSEGGYANWTVQLKGLDEKLPVSRRQNYIIKDFKN